MKNYILQKLFESKFKVKLLDGYFKYLPFSSYKNIDLIRQKVVGTCQGDYYEYIFYDKGLDRYFVGTTDLFIWEPNKKTISEFKELDNLSVLKYVYRVEY